MERDAVLTTPESDTETAGETMEWEAESPFLSDIPSPRSTISAAAAFGPSREVESPFTSEYALAGEVVAGPQAEQYAKLLGELHDPEFEMAVADLVNEASALAESIPTYETGPATGDSAGVERTLREYLAPVEREAHAMLDRLIDSSGERDVSTLTEAEIESLFERVQPSLAMPTPVFEDFLKKFWNKAKNAVKSAARVVGKVLPIGAVLGKLKALVRPLLERVLRFAIGKLPAPIQPAARQLARRFLGISAESEEPETTGEVAGQGQAAADPAEIQHEMDTRFAGSLLHGEDFEREFETARFAAEASQGAADPLRELEEARDRFARGITALRPGQDPTPVVEQFIPAILMAARVAIGLIGRQRVVNFLAGLLAKLVSKYVGQESATALSRALVDTGLRLVALETTPETEQLAAGYTVASTVEDTVNRLVASAPGEAWENAERLEPYVLEAFEQAASANFPDSSIKPDLHETAQQSGAWVLMPVQGQRKRYKKYTRVIEVNLTGHMAKWIRSFGGVRLSTILRDRYGIAPGTSVAARLHLYEAIRGTWLSRISSQEKGVPGLGTASRSAWTLLHPLTPCAAGILFQEPGLGSDVAPRFLADRNRIEVGQRFFYVEVPGVTPRPLPHIVPRPGVHPAPGGRPSQTRLVLDFPRGELRVFIYYSDADAQLLARGLQQKSPSAIPAMLTAGLNINLKTILAGNAPKQLKVVHEAVPTQELLPQAASVVLRIAGEKIAEWILQWVLRAIRAEVERRYDQFVQQFRKAVDDPADGVTVIVVFQGVSFFEKLRKLIASPLAGAPGILALFGARAAAASMKVDVKPGFNYW